MMRVIVLLVALPLLGQPAFAQPVERESLLDAYFQVADYGMNALMSDLARLCSKVKGLRGRELERCATSEVKKHLAMELLPPDPAAVCLMERMQEWWRHDSNRRQTRRQLLGNTTASVIAILRGDIEDLAEYEALAAGEAVALCGVPSPASLLKAAVELLLGRD